MLQCLCNFQRFSYVLLRCCFRPLQLMDEHPVKHYVFQRGGEHLNQPCLTKDLPWLLHLLLSTTLREHRSFNICCSPSEFKQIANCSAMQQLQGKMRNNICSATVSECVGKTMTNVWIGFLWYFGPKYWGKPKNTNAPSVGKHPLNFVTCLN